jgi:hypothetical protein
MVLAGILIALIGASEVSVVVAPGVPCVEQKRLVSQLESAGLRVVHGVSERLAVTIRLEHQQVMVRATRRGAPFERAVPAQPDACAGVERVVAALITSWSLQLPSPEVTEHRRAPPVAVPTTVPPLPPEPAAETPPEVLPVQVHPDEPVQAPPTRRPLHAGPSAPELPERPPEVASPLAKSPEQSTSVWTLDVAALGGGSLGPTPTPSGVGQLNVALSLGRFGALLEGGLESVRSATSTLAPTRVESSAQWLSLSGRVRFEPHVRLTLDLALGFRLWRIAAQSFNAVDARPIELLGLGGVLSAGLSFRVAGPVSVQLRGFTSVRSSRPRFLIDGLGPVLTLDPWEGGLLLGLEVRLFGGS